MGSVIDRPKNSAGHAGPFVPGASRASVPGFLAAIFRNTRVSLLVAPVIAPVILLPEKVLRRIAGTAGRWKQQQAAAALYWPRISEQELVWSDGHVVRLVALVRQHYDISESNAQSQVERFFKLNVR